MLLKEYFGNKSQLGLPIKRKDLINQIKRYFSLTHGFHFIICLSSAFEYGQAVV